MTTEDGIDWTPVVPGQPIGHEGGSSETDFAFADDGALIAVLRNEVLLEFRELSIHFPVRALHELLLSCGQLALYRAIQSVGQFGAGYRALQDRRRDHCA